METAVSANALTIETEASIDRLTVMAHDTPMFKQFLKYAEPIRCIGFSNLPGFTSKHQSVDRKLLIEYGDRGKVRIEFNPNTANMELVEDVISKVRYPHLTRLDIAIDYFGVDLSQYEWTSNAIIKRPLYKNNILETLEFGSRNSEKFYRIYNKLKERLDADAIPDPRSVNGHWRVELERHFNAREVQLYEYEDYFHDDYFSDLAAHRKFLDLSFIESQSERAILTGILADRSLLDGFSKNVKAKYRKLEAEAKSRKQVEINPYEEYKKEKSRLACQLSELLNKTISYVQV